MLSHEKSKRSALSLAIARALFAGTGIVGATAAAQGQAVTPNRELEEIVVTATRRNENILDVPYNISAVSGESIALAQILDTPELLRSVPGVSMVDRGQRNAAVVNGIRIRGLNVDSAGLGDYALSSVATVSTYVGDTPLYANFLLKDIERVEVLRGPQGTLYGSGSLGGNVRYVMAQPKLGELSGSIGGSVSKVDGADSEGWAGDMTLNLPIGDKFALRFNLSRADYPGITDYVNLYVLDSNGIPVAPNGILDPAAEYYSKKNADSVEIWYGRASARWQPTDAVDVTLNYFFQQDDVGGRRQPTPGTDGYGRPYGKYENGSIQLEPSSRDVDLTSLEIDVDLGFATLTSSTAYYDHSGDSTSENTGFYAHAGFLGFYYNYPRPMASALRTYEDKGFTEELRLVSQGDGPIDYVAGLWYQDQSLLATQDSFLRGFKAWWDTVAPGAADAVTGDQDFIYRRDESFQDFAVFGELTWHVTDRLRLTGGLRYFDNKSRNDTLIDLPAYASFSSLTEATFKSSENDVLFKANAAFDLTKDHLLYATISQGYRRGGSNAVPTVPPPEGHYYEDPRWQVYKSDTVTNYELGVKGMLGSLRYDLGAFYIDWQKPQFNTATPNWGFFVVANGKSAKSSGIELELSGNFTDRLTYSFGYTYTDAQLTADFISPIGTLIQVDGTRLPGAPETLLNAAIDYRMPLGSNYELITHLNTFYQSETRNSLDSDPRFDVTLKSFQIWDAAVTLAASKWSAVLWMKNLSNERGVTGVFTEAYMGTDPAVGYYGNGAKDLISLPRTVGLTMTYNF